MKTAPQPACMSQICFQKISPAQDWLKTFSLIFGIMRSYYRNLGLPNARPGSIFLTIDTMHKVEKSREGNFLKIPPSMNANLTAGNV